MQIRFSQLLQAWIPGALGFLLATLAATSFPACAADTTAPRIKFANTTLDFGRVKAGEIVRHTYFFTNVGSHFLLVTNVQPACGCTATTNWTRRVEPNGWGKIPIEFNSANFSGEIHKTVAVQSNDPQEPSAILDIKGTIWRPVDVLPQFAVLNILPDVPQGTTTVRIISNEGEHLAALSPPKCNSTNLTVTVRTNKPGTELQLDITSVRGLSSGNCQAQITLETTSTNVPVVTANVWVVVQPSLAIYPPQLMLPSSPLTNRTDISVTVQSQSTNSFSITDPLVNLPGVNLTVQQPISGRVYSLTLTFPQGYQLPTNTSAALTFKTSREQFQTVRVPIARGP